MNSFDFFRIFFADVHLFLFLMVFFPALLFFSVGKSTLAGYLDPIHFYWTFTFGTAYAVVTGLFLKGYVSTFHFYLILGYGLLLIISLRLFFKSNLISIPKLVNVLCVPRRGQEFCFFMVLGVYLSITIYIVFLSGAGILAETNRFEQARGYGHFVRLSEALRLFLIAYISLWLLNNKVSYGYSLKFIIGCMFLIIFIGYSSAINGSKFSFLEAIYSSIVAVALFSGKKPKFRIIRTLVLFFSALAFALLVLSINLKNNDIDTSDDAMFLGGGSVVLERLVFRILGNADKYYLGLPEDVVEKIDTDNILVRMASPVIGITNLSAMLGYNVGDYSVGRQILLHHNPEREVAGGPTSHFDLFFYKYLGLYFGCIGIFLMSYVIASIAALRSYSRNKIFLSSVSAALWLKCLPMLLEPTVGFAYLLDIVMVFAFFNFLSQFFYFSSQNVSSVRGV